MLMYTVFVSDLQTLAMVHEPVRTEVDREDPVHCAHLRTALVGQSAVLQQRELLRVLLHGARLL